MVGIQLSQVTKQLGGNFVIEGIDLELQGGNVIAVLGANGAGKTTLLHLLGGLYQPTEGTIQVDGELLERSNLDQRRRMHYLPDIPTLSPAQTPLDYIVFALEAYGRTDEVEDQVVLDLMQEFDMLAVADNPSRALSRGQRYKATLIAMLAIDPDIWIMDEPFTSGLDPLGLIAMRTHMLNAGRRGKLVVYSTQLVELAQQTSTLVCVLSDTKVAAFGSLDSLQDSADHSPALKRLLQQLRGDAEMLAFAPEPSESSTE